MLEEVLINLTESIRRLTTAVQVLNATTLSDDAGQALLKAVSKPVTTLEEVEQQIDSAKEKAARLVTDAAGVTDPDTRLGKEGVEIHIGETLIDLTELGAYLAEVANKYGAVAQDAIKGIVFDTGGTQALSQVSEAVFPIIKGKVEAWVAAQG